MLSKTAEIDVEEMWEAGLKPTVADIIRLNAVALAVERARSGFALNVLPRVAFLGEVAFREPAIGAEVWFDSASRLFAVDKAETFILLRALSLSRPQEELPDPVDERAVIAAVTDLRTRLGFATLPQVAAAVGYAVHGFDAVYGEAPEPMKSDDTEDGGESGTVSYAIGLLYDGIALRLGSVDELKKLPRRALEEMTIRAIQANAVSDVRKDAVSIAEDDYLRTLDAITARLKKEKEADGE